MANLFNTDLINPDPSVLDEAVRKATERARNFGLLNGGSGIGGLVSQEAERQLKVLSDQRDSAASTSTANTAAQNLANQQSAAFDSIINANFPEYTGGGALPIEGATTDPLTESITGKETMYGNPAAASPSAGMGSGLGSISSNIGIGGGFTGGAPKKTYSEYADPLFSLDPADSALLGLTGPNPDAASNIQSDLANAIAAAETADAYGASMPNTGVMGLIDKLSGMVKDPSLTKEIKAKALAELKAELAKREVGGDSSGSTGQVPGSGAQGLANSKAEGLVSIPGALSAFSINPAAYLYSGAGSSFESGRNEYTESGQYDIDKAARDAEFDAMREQARIDAGLPYKRLTPEETQQAVKDMQARIGGDFQDYLDNLGKSNPDTTGAYELGVADRAAAAEAEKNQGIAPFMGVPFGGGGGRR